MDEFILDLHLPDVGNVERWHCDPGEQFFIRWAPGNGLNYVLLVNVVSDNAADEIGGHLLATIRGRVGQWVSYPFSPVGFFTKGYVGEKFGKHLSEESLMYYTVLLNWALLGKPDAVQYAKELYNEAREKWV